MNLPISDATTVVTSPRNRSARWYTLIAGFMVLGGGLAIARVYTHLLERHTSWRVFETGTGFLGRHRQAMDAVPSIMSSPGPTAIYIGSSTVMFNLSPVQHDERLKKMGIDLTTYDIGTMSMTPDLGLEISHHLQVAYAKAGRRTALSVVEFNPAAATFAFKSKRSIVLKKARLLDPHLFWSHLLESPRFAGELLSVNLLGGIGPPEITRMTTTWIFGSTEEHSEEDLAHEALYQKLVSHYGGPFPSWDSALRGEFRRLYPDTQAEYERLLKWSMSEQALRESQEFFRNGADVVDLHIAPEQVENFIQMVETLRTFSDRTVLLLMPRNPKWDRPSEEGEQRLRDAIAEVVRRTNLPLIDFRHRSDFSDADFCDFIHLNEISGKGKFTALMADEIAPFLKTSAKAELTRQD